MNSLEPRECSICQRPLSNSRTGIRSHVNAHVRRGELKEAEKRKAEELIFSKRRDTQEIISTHREVLPEEFVDSIKPEDMVYTPVRCNHD